MVLLPKVNKEEQEMFKGGVTRMMKEAIEKELRIILVGWNVGCKLEAERDLTDTEKDNIKDWCWSIVEELAKSKSK